MEGYRNAGALCREYLESLEAHKVIRAKLGAAHDRYDAAYRRLMEVLKANGPLEDAGKVYYLDAASQIRVIEAKPASLLSLGGPPDAAHACVAYPDGDPTHNGDVE